MTDSPPFIVDRHPHPVQRPAGCNGNCFKGRPCDCRADFDDDLPEPRRAASPLWQTLLALAASGFALLVLLYVAWQRFAA